MDVTGLIWMQLCTIHALGSVHVIAHLAGQSCGHLDGLSSVLLVTHACIYDLVGLHNVLVFMQVVGTEVFDTWVLQTVCLIFKYVFMQQNVFLSAGE